MSDDIKEILFWLFSVLVSFALMYCFYIAGIVIQKEQEEKGSIDGLASIKVNDSSSDFQSLELCNGEFNQLLKIHLIYQKDMQKADSWKNCLFKCLYTGLKDNPTPGASVYEACFDVCEVYN